MMRMAYKFVTYSQREIRDTYSWEMYVFLLAIFVSLTNQVQLLLILLLLYYYYYNRTTTTTTPIVMCLCATVSFICRCVSSSRVVVLHYLLAADVL